MYKFTLENKNGDQLTFNEIGGDFTIDEVNGLSPADATINTSPGAYIDGELFNSSKVDMRTLEIAFAIEREAAKNRIAIYNVLKPKQYVKANYTGQYRDVYIEGYVQSVNITHYEMKQVCTVSILCPSPFWRDAQAVIDELSNVQGMFHFPFAALENPEEAEADEYTEFNRQLVFSYLDPTSSVAIENNGDVQTGIVIELYASDTVVNPKVWDYVTGDFIGVNFTMQTADSITIDTRAGEKTITLLRNGVTTNIFNSLMKGSTWLELDFGGGVYAYEVGGGNAESLLVTINHNNLYEGV